MSHRDLLDTKPQSESAPALVTSKHRALTPQVLLFLDPGRLLPRRLSGMPKVLWLPKVYLRRHL